MTIERTRLKWQAFKKGNPEFVKNSTKQDLGPALDKATKVRDDILKLETQLETLLSRINGTADAVVDSLGQYGYLHLGTVDGLHEFRDDIALLLDLAGEVRKEKASYLKDLKNL